MRKIGLLLLICTGLACKKNSSDDLTKYNWVISSAVVTPAMTINGKTSTNFLEIANSSTCLTGLTYVFQTNGIFVTGSNGPLCDRVPDGPNQKWTREGNMVKLSYGGSDIREGALSGNKLIIVDKNIQNNTEYTIAYTFIAKEK